MRSRGWIATTIGLAILAAACTRDAATPSRQQESPIAVGDTAPAFTLESASGGPVSLSDYAGKPVLLYFSMGPG
jgi:cytochrome oxidase Cu insertion factor (SCO1/SenC/PrrC family)